MNEENINVNENNEEQENQTYTFEQVQALLQSEGDRRVQQALKKQQQKFDRQLKQQKSLSSLDESARESAEKDLRIQELQEQLAEFNRIKVKNEIQTVLSERGLNPKFADYLSLGEDVEEVQEKIEAFDKLVKALVKSEVEKKIGSNVPKMTSISTSEITKEDFRKMHVAEQMELYRENKELYMKLAER